MTTGETRSNNYGPTPRRGLPGWVWGIGACACLPIVGVVALGLLAMPAIKRFKEASREAGRTNICLSNVRQCAIAMQTYAQDYDDHLPPASSWMDATSAF